MEINNTDHTILLIDDEVNILRAMKRLLMEDDYNILTASSGAKGLELLGDNRFSLIISDQRMPEMTGIEFFAQARQKAPDTVRIMLTGYSDVSATMDAINKGEVYKYITKPWNDDELRLNVREAVERYSLIRENKRLTELTRKQNEELKQWNEKLEERVEEQTEVIKKRNRALGILIEKLEKNFKSCLEAFSGLIDMRSLSINNHSKNVAELAVSTAKAMSLSEEEVETIRAAAMLHDIGEIGIPDAILEKKEKSITREEKKQIEQHPIRGQAALEPIEELRDAGILIRHHHEWFNGRGYPDRLAGSKIPLGSRIIAIADAVDRIADSESQGRKYNFTTALKVIEADVHTKYDLEIFKVAKPIVMELSQDVYRNIGSDEDEYLPGDLSPGMILSRDVRSGTGVLILRQGTELSMERIMDLKRYYEIDPSVSGTYIWKKSYRKKKGI